MGKKGTISMIQTLMVFVIVLAAVMMTGGSLGKKVTEGARDFNLPAIGAECPEDAGIVDNKTFMENIRKAAKVAWNGKRACWLKQELDPTFAAISYADIYDNITNAMNTWNEKETDDCLGGYFTDTSLGSIYNLDMVFWWDDKATCNSNGVISSTWTWISGELGSSQNTLYFYEREDYCIGGNDIYWYNPLGNSNIAKFSQNKRRLNDANICRDERDSNGVGTDYRLPNIVDLSEETDSTAKNDIKTEISNCAIRFENDFMGSYANNLDYNGYFACQNTLKIKPDVDADLDEWFPLSGVYYSISGLQYPMVGFSYTHSDCDLLNPTEDDINPDEFNSVTWIRGDSDANCLYMIKNRLMINQSGMESSESNKLLADNIYEIQAFYYFEERFYGPTGTPYDSDDIIIVIEDKT